MMGWRQILLALVAFGCVAMMLVAIGVMPAEVVSELVRGSVGTKNNWNETIKHMVPLLIAGLAVFIALRAGLFNIGAEGQILMGALAATVVALNVAGIAGTLLSLLAGVVAGALWALPAGWIKAYRNGHEVITTIMLNNVAGAVAIGLIAGPLKGDVGQSTTTDVVHESTWLPLMTESPVKLSLAIPIALALLWAVALWIKRTVAGYELCATGANSKAAATAGVEVKKVTLNAMLFSGALAGLAGAVQMLAYEHNFYTGFSSGFGFDALGVALLAGGSPWGVLPAAFAFGALAKGTTSIQTLGVPSGMSGVLLAVLIIVFAAFRYRRAVKHD